MGEARELADKLRELGDLSSKLMRAVYEETLVVEGVSRDRTPVRWGALQGSHETSEPEIDSEGNISCKISVGGPAAPYAVFVHEDLNAHHEVGEAKFLERSVNEARPGFAARVLARAGLI